MGTLAVWHPWPFFPLFWFGWIVLAVLLFAFGGRWFGWRRWRSDESRSSGERVLAERYARGDIDEDEYHRRLTVLSGKDR